MAHLSDRWCPLYVICAANPAVGYRWDDQDRRGGGSRKLPREPSVARWPAAWRRRSDDDHLGALIVGDLGQSLRRGARRHPDLHGPRIGLNDEAPEGLLGGSDDCWLYRCQRFEINHMGDDKTQSQTRGKVCCDAQRLSGAVAAIRTVSSPGLS